MRQACPHQLEDAQGQNQQDRDEEDPGRPEDDRQRQENRQDQSADDTRHGVVFPKACSAVMPKRR